MEPVKLDICRQAGGPLRPTYCNVPDWAEIALYISSFVAIAVFAYGVWLHYRAWKAGQPDAPERNTGRAGERVGLFLSHVLGQRATVKRRFPGIFHSGMFYGFALLFIGTALATVDYDVFKLIFGRRILFGSFYLGYEAVLDLAGVVFTAGLLLAIVRRYVMRPQHVLAQWDFMIWSLLLINVTGFLIEGLRLTFAPVPHGTWSWAGYGLSQLFFGMGMGVGSETAAGWHISLWLLHAGASLVWIAALPFNNAAHLLSTSANLILQPLGTKIGIGAALQPIDIEAAEFFGVGRLEEFNWKQRLGLDACLRCGRCETVCPAYMSGTPLNPKQVIMSLGDGLRAEMHAPIFSANGEGEVVVGADALVHPDALFACTTCMACVEVCPATIEIVDDIVDMRRYLALTEGALPGTSTVTLRNMGTNGNPWGYAQEDRTKWAEGLEVPIATEGEDYELLYWVGCSGSYDQRNMKISRAFVKLLDAAGVRYAIMREESCTCESARRLGDEYLYQTATEVNVANLGKYDFERIVSHCPHCFNTIANEFPQFGGDFEVIHHSQVLRELLDAGRLKVPASAAEAARVTFHDSCYLGRYNREFEAPRASLRAAGVEVVDPPRTRDNGLCCGGGGGKMWFEGEAEQGVNLIRMEELLGTKPDVVGVSCPYCLTMMDDAKAVIGERAAQVQVRDVAEILAEALD